MVDSNNPGLPTWLLITAGFLGAIGVVVWDCTHHDTKTPLPTPAIEENTDADPAGTLQVISDLEAHWNQRMLVRLRDIDARIDRARPMIRRLIADLEARRGKEVAGE